MGIMYRIKPSKWRLTMEKNLMQELSKEVEEATEKAGGIAEFIENKENKNLIRGWLEDIINIAWIFNNNNGFELSINGEKYRNCYFKVGRYDANPKAMFISVYGIKDSDEDIEEYFIDTITVFNSTTLYDNKRITVKEEFVPILRKLEIILDDRRIKVSRQESHNTMDYIDKYYCVCSIDIDNLKRFCKEWNYQYE